MLKVRVEDNKKFATVMMWARESQQLLGKTVDEIRDHTTQDPTYRLMCPKEVHRLNDKTLLIRLQCRMRANSECGRRFSVSKVIDANDLILKYVCTSEDVHEVN